MNNSAPDSESWIKQFNQNGFCLLPQFFDEASLASIRLIIEDFHQAWKEDNWSFYQFRAINSAYLTDCKYLEDSQRTELFKFIANSRLVAAIAPLFNQIPGFMGTQLFFDPVDPKKKNYWHRDPQYHLDLAQQKIALKGPEVLHCRIALTDEPGLEVIPGSHKIWDTPEQLDVRLERNGRKNFEDLPQGVKIPLKAGDVLLFSANMIHRGHYGLDRLVLDILYCEAEPELLKFVRSECLPSEAMLQQLPKANPLAITKALLA